MFQDLDLGWTARDKHPRPLPWNRMTVKTMRGGGEWTSKIVCFWWFFSTLLNIYGDPMKLCKYIIIHKNVTHRKYHMIIIYHEKNSNCLHDKKKLQTCKRTYHMEKSLCKSFISYSGTLLSYPNVNGGL